MVAKPTGLTIRAYGVGFGDCFLLTFHYSGATADRHMLIDFGSTQKPPNARKDPLMAIAKDIASVVGDQLHVLVATHRHADHINGFTPATKGKGGKGPDTGDIIAGLKPGLVIQPWTEKPDAPVNWDGHQTPAARDAAFTTSLARMQRAAEISAREAAHLGLAIGEEIEFVGDRELSNKAAVENLARMGKKTKAVYVRYGSRLPTARLLPGVTIKVLGPPTLHQKSDVKTQNPENKAEYWHFHSFWQLRKATADLHARGTALFPRAATYSSVTPPQSRWFIGQTKEVRGNQLLRIVRAMDDALNNTSVILLIKAGKKRLLFPGDAQWENWEHALGKQAAALRRVDLYKVGHHGSLNATPKTLWKLLTGTRRSTAKPLHTLLSTRSDSKHGDRDRKTEVPRETLLAALRESSTLRTTQELEGGTALALKLSFDL